MKDRLSSAIASPDRTGARGKRSVLATARRPTFGNMAATAAARLLEAQSSDRSHAYSRVARGRRRTMLGLIVLAHVIVVWGLLQWRDVREIEILPLKVIVKIIAEPQPSEPEGKPPASPQSRPATSSTKSSPPLEVAPATMPQVDPVGSAAVQPGSEGEPASLPASP